MSNIKKLTEQANKYGSITVTLDVNEVMNLLKERDALAAENGALKGAISHVSDTDNQPDYQYDGMGCGIEDRGIVDRYEAARYGWDEAVERFYSEVMPCAADIETPATDAYLKSVRAEGVKMLADRIQQTIEKAKLNSDEIGALAGAIFTGAAIAEKLRAGEPS